MTTKYFNSSGTLPNFTQYYNWQGWTNGGVINVFAKPIDFNTDGKQEIVVTFSQMLSNNGKVTNDATPNRVAIFQVQTDGSYKDITESLLNSYGVTVLPGMARNFATGDLNNDGKLDIAFALNREDGRSGANWEYSRAQSVAFVSQSDGTYKTIEFGNPDWSQSITIVNVNGVGHIYFQGYTNNNGTRMYGDSVTGVVMEGADLVLNETQTSFVKYSGPPISGSGVAAIAPSTANGTSNKIVSGVLNSNRQELPALSVQQDDGSWKIVSVYQPYKSTSIPYVSWNNELGSAVAIEINGTKLFGAGYDSYQTLPEYFPGSPSVAVLRLSGTLNTSPRSDGNYYQLDGARYGKYEFYQTVNDEIKTAPISIIGEETYQDILFVDFLDLNKDNLLDIIGYPFNVSGAPTVYLNTGSGTFAKLNSSVFPSAPYNWITNFNYPRNASTFMDANGDGIYDLLYYVTTVNRPNNTPMIYFGNESILNIGDNISYSITVNDRIGSPLIKTFAGDDTVFDTNANSSSKIYGGLGSDTMIYSGKFSDYVISKNDDGTITVKSASLIDQLFDFETIKFSDYTIITDALNNVTEQVVEEVTENVVETVVENVVEENVVVYPNMKIDIPQRKVALSDDFDFSVQIIGLNQYTFDF